MISIISPAKSMNFNESTILIDDFNKNTTFPVEINFLIKNLKNLSVDNIKKIMKVSDKIAELNYQRFNNFEKLPAKEALLAYDGDVYNNIQRDNINVQQKKHAQKYLRIISGLYGLLKPFDYIKPYRLEMVTKLDNIAKKGLANFWKDKITDKLNQDIKETNSKYLINLASNEYIAAIDQKKLNAPLININFREERNGTLKNIALNAKKARGMMADYIIKHQITNEKDLLNFNINDYSYNKILSDQTNYFFTKHN